MANEAKTLLEIRKCRCGSDVRLGQSLYDGEVRKGKAGKRTYALFTMFTPIGDPARVKTLLSVPVLTQHFDVCKGCGSYYCFLATVEEVPTAKLEGSTN